MEQPKCGSKNEIVLCVNVNLGGAVAAVADDQDLQIVALHASLGQCHHLTMELTQFLADNLVSIASAA